MDWHKITRMAPDSHHGLEGVLRDVRTRVQKRTVCSRAYEWAKLSRAQEPKSALANCGKLICSLTAVGPLPFAVVRFTITSVCYLIKNDETWWSNKPPRSPGHCRGRASIGVAQQKLHSRNKSIILGRVAMPFHVQTSCSEVQYHHSLRALLQMTVRLDCASLLPCGTAEPLASCWRLGVTAAGANTKVLITSKSHRQQINSRISQRLFVIPCPHPRL